MTSVNLAELRLSQPGCPSDLALDSLVANEASQEEAASLRSHIEHCPHCPERMAMRRQGFAAFPALDAEKPLRALQAFREASARPGFFKRLLAWLRGPRWALMTAGAAAAVLAIVLVRGHMPGSSGDARLRPPWEPDDVRLKGGCALHVFRQRDQGAEEMVSGDRFRPGDNLRFAVDLPRPGYVAILGVDAQGKQYVAWPLPGHQAARPGDTQRPAGKRQELEGGVTLDAALGEESLYLIACPTSAGLSQCHLEDAKPSCAAGCAMARFALRKTR